MMRMRRKTVWVGVFAVGLVLGASSFYVWWSLRHMKIDLPLDAFVQRILPQARVIGAALRANGNCFAAVDDSSMGNREKEAEMSFIATMPGLYESRFGHAPSNISDLRRLQEFDRPDSLNGHAFLRDCSIYASPGGSFVVSCGQSRPPAAKIAAFTRNPPTLRKFAMIDKSEVLYIPAPKC